MTINAQAQWFDFSENTNRAVIGVNTGLVGYSSIDKIAENKEWGFTDVGVGVSAVLAGVYADFVYVSPDHRFDSHVVNYDWDDHSALTINAGYQIPIFKDYVFLTPLIGFSRATIGITEGNNIDFDPDARSIYHKYTVTDSHNYFNYGGMLTVAPCKWFEINATFTAHAAYLGIGVDLMKYRN